MSDATALGLVPAPTHCRLGEGRLELPARVPVWAEPEDLDALTDLVGPGSGRRFVPAAAEADAVLRLGRDGRPAEAYRLSVTPSGVQLTGGGSGGLQHGIQTLRQLLPAWACGLAPIPGRPVWLPVVEIEDEPRFAWRGVHLDVGRHFQPLSWLFRFVDQLALHKLNVLHVHLTEDQGWRFEVKGHPRLAEVGSWRPETRLPAWTEGDGTPHGGFYRQDQLRALVEYAGRRGLTIVPEVDVPGHVRALLAAYPEFGDGTGERGVATTPGIFPEVLQLTPATVAMVEDVFTELLDVFPSRHVHIGGDECPRDQWRASDEAARLATERGLGAVDELQGWLTDHLRAWLADRGRTLVGWDEIVEDRDVPGAVVMSWRGVGPGRSALARGHQVVMAPADSTYFDYYPSDDAGEPYAIGGGTTWQDVLAFDPAEGVPAEHRDRLLGVQGQLWTEYLPTPSRVEYMAFPRVSALAQVAWSEEQPEVSDFEARLRRHLPRLDASGVGYRPLDGPAPWQRGGTGRWARPVSPGR